MSNVFAKSLIHLIHEACAEIYRRKALYEEEDFTNNQMNDFIPDIFEDVSSRFSIEFPEVILGDNFRKMFDRAFSFWKENYVLKYIE